MTDISSSSSPSSTESGAQAPELRSAATFEVLPLSREVRETLAEIGYTHPTPVQIAVWDPATRGKDAVVQARTGTGKTAAFGLPIVDHIVRRSLPQVQALVLCPTRELAVQVASEIDRLGKKKNVRVSAIYGGAAMQRQIDEINDGAQVVVGTPGRVLDHLRRGTLNPKHIRLLVLDESDEMLSMGFEREVTAILDSLPKERQTLLFSATVPPDIERMAKKLRAPEYITLSGDHIGALEIEHFVYMVASDKMSALVRIIEVENPESAVVFCNTKDETERVAQTLTRQGYDADWLNGDLPQDAREKVMTRTREGRLRFLVATDVAARGIDISHLTHVINHDFPQDAESYVHRTGRTGRAGRTGTAISLIMPQDVGGLYLLRLTFKIRPIERQIPTEGELKTRAEADLVSMLAEAFATRAPHPEDLALARRLLTHEQCDAVLAGLLRDHLGARPTAREDAASARRASRAIPVKAETPAPVAAPKRVAEPRAAEPRPSAPEPRPSASGKEARPAAFTITQAEPPAVSPVEARPPTQEARPLASGPDSRPSASSAEPRQEPKREEERPPRGREESGRGERRPRPNLDARRGRGEGRGRPREEFTPVAAAEGSREGAADPQRSPQRHADFITWQPPEEEGDDEPILGAEEVRVELPRRPDRERSRPDSRRGPHIAIQVPVRLPAPEAEGEFVEIYVNVGRREGARAADFQRTLTERANIDKANVRRIRVRERNAFVSVRREDLAKAIEALTGATIAGKTAAAEQARERSAEGEATGEHDAASPAIEETTTVTSVSPPHAGEPAITDGPASDESVPTGRGPGAVVPG